MRGATRELEFQERIEKGRDRWSDHARSASKCIRYSRASLPPAAIAAAAAAKSRADKAGRIGVKPRIGVAIVIARPTPTAAEPYADAGTPSPTAIPSIPTGIRGGRREMIAVAKTGRGKTRLRSENLALAANRLRSRPLANRSRSLKRWFVIALWFVAWNSPRFESWNWAWLRLEPWTCVCALTPEVPARPWAFT